MRQENARRGKTLQAWFGLVWFGLVSLFIQGKPLASGYYSRHPERTQYKKTKKEDKTEKVQGR